jgi:hypothetical protein
MNTNSNSDSNCNSHEPLIDSALIGLNLTAEYHLSNCACCQGEREKTEQALQHFAALQREQASRPESFWEEQAKRIRAVRRFRKFNPSVAAVLAPAAMLLLVLALMLVPRRPAQPQVNAAQGPIVSDQDLLVAVEQAVNSGTPDALEPVALAVDVPETTSVIPTKRIAKEPASHEN